MEEAWRIVDPVLKESTPVYEHEPGSWGPDEVNIPLDQLGARLDELPRDREIHVICHSGQRAYYATRILLQNGFTAKNVSGGMLSRAQASLFDTDTESE